ncbi:MAG: DUF3502 domain-containing protein [Candidatus Cohnella colombiensis]|uniref:DUF3502 domain-containing protein n=1 Tax=Candidatus Cohnella colombiensis TaxID=3121368 RepID=A0AA95JFX8_9BACL|nr:MAG: DUF3502 domain-containing protein [Cohnella sp.]
MNIFKRMLILCITVCLCASLVACSLPWNRSKQSIGSNSDVTTLVGYLIGTAPPGLPKVLEQLNHKLEQDIGVNLDLQYIQWGDMATRYPQILSSGGNIDFVFAGNWAYYAQEANKGSFYEITEDMVKKYMPRHYKATNEVAWEEAKVGGKIYIIPSSTPDMKVPVTLIRDDLRKQYGLPEMNRLMDLEPFLAAVKANAPNMIPIQVDKQYDFIKTSANLMWEMGPATVDVVMTTNGFSGVYTDWDDPSGKLLTIYDEPLRSNYIAAAKLVKSWVDQGYINANAFVNKTRSKDLFEQGKSAVAYGNSNDIQSTIAKADEQGWEVKIIPNLSINHTYIMDPYINNGVAIATDSKHVELVMQALDLIMEDPEYNQLVYYGIQGEHFTIDDGKISIPNGMLSEEDSYPPDAAGFWFTNKSQLLPLASWNDEYAKHKSEIGDMLIPYVYAAFNFNALNVQRELDQVNQAAIQYLNPILSGMVSNVDEAFKVAESEINKAGFATILKEAQRQTNEYLHR